MKNEERYLVRSRAVFDGVGAKPEPMTILVEDGRIRRILSWDYLAGDDSLRELPLRDYGEQMIMPSFIDAHTHMFSGAAAASEFVCDTLGEGKSQEECVEILKRYAKEHPQLERLRGTGWFIGNWEEKVLPDKRSLDRAFPDRPVYLQCADGHSFWVNTRAIEEAGIVPRPELQNGEVCVWENGELTGLLLEPAACEPAMEKYQEFSDGQMLAILRDFQKLLAENGVSAVSEMFAEDYTEDILHRYLLMKQLDEAGELTANAYFFTKLFGYTEFSRYFAMKEQVDSRHVKLAGVKGFLDGVTETHTGLLLEPYEDQKNTCGDGLPLWPQERMQEEIIAANRNHIPVRLHCIADGSVRMALDMFEQAGKENGGCEVRNTIEHIENIHPDDIGRFREIGVIPSMQPYHLTLSNNGKILQIGKERCRYEWPIKTILEAGGRMAFGTDFPVVTINPFRTIYAAVTRKSDEGVQFSQNPWETVSMETALKCYTSGSAYVYGLEEETGSLEEGKMANLIVLDRNLFEIPEEQIEDTRVVANYFEGRCIYSCEDRKLP
ncbi:MAG: amidohydrolase [Clostridiales bacterium]|nr:amidohydrolase [Clostridiales bacterium]